MPTVEQLARHIAGITNSNEDLLLIGNWINARWKELANTSTLRALRRVGELRVAAVEATGTVAVTQGSKTVTGTGTAFDTTHAGQEIVIRNTFYRIATVASSTSLTLVNEYAGDTQTGANFHIVNRAHRLDKGIRKLGTFVHMRTRRALEVSSRDGLDLAAPSRFAMASVPHWVSEATPDVDGVKRVEIYPYSSREEIYHYVYWAEPQDLGFDDPLPSFIDEEAFREGVMVDVYRNKMFRAADEGKENLTAFWRNEFRAQETRWLNTHKVRVMGQDDAMDDLEFILTTSRAHPRFGGTNFAITDAYAEIWFTGR